MGESYAGNVFDRVEVCVLMLWSVASAYKCENCGTM